MFHKPPPKKPYDPFFAAPFVRKEAQRQVEKFFDYLSFETMEDAIDNYELAIYSALDCGTAIILDPEGDIFFWNPISGEWEVYDEDYNHAMVAFLEDFRRRH